MIYSAGRVENNLQSNFAHRGLSYTMAKSLCIWCLIACALIVFMPYSVASASSEMTVELPERIEVRDGGFFLGEYARFDGESDLADRASMAFITPRGAYLERRDVVYALGAAGLGGRTISVRMPDKVAVAEESRIVKELRTMTGWSWRIELERVPEEFIGNFLLPSGLMPGCRSVSISFDDDKGRRLRRQIKLKWYQPALFFKANMSRGASLDRADVGFRIETPSLHRVYVWERSQIVGAALKQSVLAGRAVALTDIEKAKIIKSGSIITLIATVNGLGVEARGMALQHGGVGDIIRVRNMSSKKVITGRVIDMGRVAIN